MPYISGDWGYKRDYNDLLETDAVEDDESAEMADALEEAYCVIDDDADVDESDSLDELEQTEMIQQVRLN